MLEESMGFQDPKDWIGAEVQFRCEADGDGSRLNLAHVGPMPPECANVCPDGWRLYTNQSLRGYLDGTKGLAWDGSPKAG